MKKRCELRMNSTVKTSVNQTVQNPLKKSRNVPAQIWLKRNLLKKLTLQLKFNKNTTQEYRKFRQPVNDSPGLHQISANFLHNQGQIMNDSQILTLSTQRRMGKLSNAKAENLTKYTENFFTSNAFSKNGLKSYHYKSSAFQANNFINVSKVDLLLKNNYQKINDQPSYQRKSFSHRQRKGYENRDQTKHKRSFSQSANYQKKPQEPQEPQASADFLKVSTKQIHMNSIHAFLHDCTKNSKSIFTRRLRTEAKSIEILANKKQELTKMEPKSKTLVRPKSCIVKAKKRFEQFSHCEGWVTVTGENRRQEDEPFTTLF